MAHRADEGEPGLRDPRHTSHLVGGFNLITAEHGRAELDKLRALPSLLADIATVTDAAARDGRVGLARHLAATSASVDRYLATPPCADDPLCRQSPPSELGGADAERWLHEVHDLVEHTIRPALAGYSRPIGEVAARGRDDDQAGFCWLDGGEELYATLLRSHSSLELAAVEIHDISVDQIDQLEQEYREVAGPLFGTTSIDEINARLVA